MGRHIENSCQDPNLIENKRKMIWSLFLITVILIAKLTGAFFTRSLALLSDSWHLVTDLTSLLISYWGLRMAAIPATHKYTFGHHRHGIFTALINNFSLIAVSIFIFYKAVQRFLHPVTVEPKGMIILALLGLVVNCIIVINLKDSKSLNIRSAFLHFLGVCPGRCGCTNRRYYHLFYRLDRNRHLAQRYFGFPDPQKCCKNVLGMHHHFT
ncbi:cation diffusion facilitator family transporter [Syntrophaceticus schinkii]|uniref:Cation diffusion facilitator family transporter (Part 1) n=1 Tax=Syntrophaceticus schinkii TaxID=499207 RepID=A0A0B7MPN8_9FIRM|nr:cation diffusion facilitator family transporter [Syntrophaceticus schinkii]CEO89991.1 Cation diffusion facilitator family transporter (Part 1) [Syntrophaceticus schinkii]